ncbi:NAD(P)H-hydrate dehydratase [Clostridium sp. C105KSO13]|uniref:NAD(P)H-hydrate dehydratase n=1 Tax=Clostridium sp. C105KSO13 TaxID=1776045 RepID=UPI0007407AEA|nr:NAD(P)H-hydrate dehydratase [Clostridium sp. C105KSO13]CUX50045.1 Bifunctional NAD(P)H-hydrate repair enzyme Nnr [Clostridium sp. C105KSO13]
MRYLPTGEWMQEADRYTIQEIGIPSMVLMERAALKTVDILEKEQVNLDKTLIVCGSGNNGGDGFAIARLLKEKGYEVTVSFIGKEASMSEDCRQQLKIAKKCGVCIVTSINRKEYTSVVDAVFGVGLNREITGAYRENIEKMNHLPGQKVAVDIPSGICSATGTLLGTAFLAELTVTFACEKLGCILYPGHVYAGKTIVADIGVSREIFEKEPSVCYTFDRADLPKLLPARKPNSHKGTYGKVLMITGSLGMAGAAFLSAKAAYITGAGLIQVYTAKENRSILQQLLPEAIISTYTDYDEENLHRLLDWADVVCIGCGLGRTDVSKNLVVGTVKRVKTPCVIDADALYILSRHTELLKGQERKFVLTPHMKEMTGLLGCTMEELQKERFEKLQTFTEQCSVVCALKDARTLVSKRDRQIFVNTAGNSSMAKAGSGDVLAGVIAGLMAQGLGCYESAACGVYLHACGGDEAKKAKGSYSTLADDLITGIGICIKKTEENMVQ